MTRLAKLAAMSSLVFVCAVFVDTPTAEAQYYASAPAVSYVPTRVGLFGWRVGYRPVVSYPAPVYAAPVYAAPPVTTYYRAPVVVAPPVTTYYRAPRTVYRAPVVIAPPIRTYYRAPLILPRRVYYAPAPPVYIYP
jgi:hypothetical protein